MRIVWLMFLLLLNSCFKNGVESTRLTDNGEGETYTPAAPVTYDADIFLKEGFDFSFSLPTILDPSRSDWSGYTFSVTGLPSWASVDPSTGILSGTAVGNGISENVVFEANHASSPDYLMPLSVAINGDPLRQHAWHLKNTGQKAFSLGSGGTAGYDINVEEVYKMGYTGSGIRVAVSDSGVEINHDDIYQNSLAGEHKNYSVESPYFSLPVAANFHGTAVTSLISAKGWNNVGSMGVAPESKFAGFQFLNSPQSSSILINQASGSYDIFNYSYGDFIVQDNPSDSAYLAQIKYMAKYGRNNLGSFFVKAAGNEFYGKGEDGCFPHNANAPFENESPHIIIVGAVDADGKRADYSNTGSNLWISAPGGLNGRYDGPAIIAADLPTCFKGASKATGIPWNDFEYNHPLNQQCNYTSTMNGTSSATPIASGVIALILDANPYLSNRDVKHILASTAEKVDSSSQAWPQLNHPGSSLGGCPDYDLSGYEYEQGWKTNTGGFSFHNYYGFGLIDAQAAVEMALDPSVNSFGDWIPMPTQIELNEDFDLSLYSSAPSASIPDNNSTGVSDSISFSNSQAGVNSDFKVETVSIKVNVTHTFSGEVGIELTSPQGTKSILLNINNSFSNPEDGYYDSNLDIVLTTNAFYGEDAFDGSGNATWTIKAVDGFPVSSGTLNGWSINVLGHNP